MHKISYPNYSDPGTSKPAYDISKWVDVMKQVYMRIHMGSSKNDAVNECTINWDKLEKIAFLNWMKFYEGKEHLKYKTAQNNYYVSEDIPNYFIPNPAPSSFIPPSPLKDINNVSTEAKNAVISNKEQALNKEEKRRIIEEQRRKILGRLHSAEKLLSSQDGQIFAGSEFEKLLNSIYELKKQIQIVNKNSFANSIYNDLIIRQSNILKNQGFIKSADFVYKLSQNTPGNFNANQGPLPLDSKIDGKGTLPNNTPDLTEPGLDKDKKEKSFEGIAGFIDNLETSGITDLNSVEDEIILEQEILPLEKDDELFVEAQLNESAPVKSQENLEPAVAPEKQEQQKGWIREPKSKFDELIDAAFSDITIQDVIDKLEEVNVLFKNREISRQLAIIDAMLNKLGLASFFPSLPEAQHKMLEASTYVNSRIEGILSSLRGSIGVSEIDLLGEKTELNLTPEQKALRDKIKQQREQEVKLKDMKKKVRDKELVDKLDGEKPAVENVQQELAEQPTEVVAPTPTPAPAPPTSAPVPTKAV